MDRKHPHVHVTTGTQMVKRENLVVYEVSDLSTFERQDPGEMFLNNSNDQDLDNYFAEDIHKYAIYIRHGVYAGKHVMGVTSASGVGSKFFEKFEDKEDDIIHTMVTSRKWSEKLYYRMYWEDLKNQLTARLVGVTAQDPFRTNVGSGLCRLLLSVLAGTGYRDNAALLQMEKMVPVTEMAFQEGRAIPKINENVVDFTVHGSIGLANAVHTLIDTHRQTHGTDDVWSECVRLMDILAESPPTATDVLDEPRVCAYLKAFWKRSNNLGSELGTLMHAAIEDHLKGKPFTEEWLGRPEIKHFLEYEKQLEAKGGEIYRVEMRLFSHPLPEELRRPGYRNVLLAGTADLITVYGAEGDTLILGIEDWKRSKETLSPNPGAFAKKGFGPCADVWDTPYWHYSINMNVYKWLLETYYINPRWRGRTYQRCVVRDMTLVVLHPNNDTYLTADVQPLPNLLQSILDHFELDNHNVKLEEFDRTEFMHKNGFV